MMRLSPKGLAERYHPYAVAIVTAWLTVSHLQHVIGWANSHSVDVKGFFGAIFNFAAVTTAFMLSSFTLAMAPGGGFIERIFHTRTFRLFLRYLAEALSLGLLLTLLSIPFMVWEVKIATPGVRLALFIWVTVAVAAILGFIRITRIFLVWIRVSAATRPKQVGTTAGSLARSQVLQP